MLSLGLKVSRAKLSTCISWKCNSAAVEAAKSSSGSRRTQEKCDSCKHPRWQQANFSHTNRLTWGRAGSAVRGRCHARLAGRARSTGTPAARCAPVASAPPTGSHSPWSPSPESCPPAQPPRSCSADVIFILVLWLQYMHVQQHNSAEASSISRRRTPNLQLWACNTRRLPWTDENDFHACSALNFKHVVCTAAHVKAWRHHASAAESHTFCSAWHSCYCQTKRPHEGMQTPDVRGRGCRPVLFIDSRVVRKIVDSPAAGWRRQRERCSGCPGTRAELPFL